MGFGRFECAGWRWELNIFVSIWHGWEKAIVGLGVCGVSIFCRGK